MEANLVREQQVAAVRPKEDESALIAANVAGSMASQIEELIDDFQTREVAVVAVKYQGTEAVAIG